MSELTYGVRPIDDLARVVDEWIKKDMGSRSGTIADRELIQHMWNVAATLVLTAARMGLSLQRFGLALTEDDLVKIARAAHRDALKELGPPGN